MNEGEGGTLGGTADNATRILDERWRRIGAALAFCAVAAGAFGAHALAANPRVDVWKTGALYHLVHAVALCLPQLPVATRTCFLAGILTFSGSLYALVLLDEPRLGMVTPFGGVAFLAGWAVMAVRPGGTLPKPQ